MVTVDGADVRALAYPALVGMPRVGDRVLLNTTALDLRLGYRTTYRVFDAQAAQVKLYEAKVTGREKVKVDAGEFFAWVVETKELDGNGSTTYWIAENGIPVKYKAIVPAMGGAVVTGELLAPRP